MLILFFSQDDDFVIPPPTTSTRVAVTKSASPVTAAPKTNGSAVLSEKAGPAPVAAAPVQPIQLPTPVKEASVIEQVVEEVEEEEAVIGGGDDEVVEDDEQVNGTVNGQYTVTGDEEAEAETVVAEDREEIE